MLTGGPPGGLAAAAPMNDPPFPSKPPDPEVPPGPKRRRFSAQDKLRILRAAERCSRRGELGALLRREGIYSSHLAAWRKARDQGSLRALSEHSPGRPSKAKNPLASRLKELERENRRLQGRLKQSEFIIEFQKKVAEILKEDPKPTDEDGSGS